MKRYYSKSSCVKWKVKCKRLLSQTPIINYVIVRPPEALFKLKLRIELTQNMLDDVGSLDKSLKPNEHVPDSVILHCMELIGTATTRISMFYSPTWRNTPKVRYFETLPKRCG